MTVPTPSLPAAPTPDLRGYGYAPGNYFVRCLKCERRFMGDKRATRCEKCARKLAEAAQSAPAVPTPAQSQSVEEIDAIAIDLLCRIRPDVSRTVLAQWMQAKDPSRTSFLHIDQNEFRVIAAALRATEERGAQEMRERCADDAGRMGDSAILTGCGAPSIDEQNGAEIQAGIISNRLRALPLTLTPPAPSGDADTP